MAERVTPLEARRSAGESSDEQQELLEELARQREEILRLRDLLIGKDAELGAVKGKLAELEEHSLRLTTAARRLQAIVPGLGRAAHALRGRIGRKG